MAWRGLQAMGVFGFLTATAVSWAKPPEGPSVTWAVGESRRYLFKADVITPNVLPMWAVRNVDGMVLGFRIDLLATCTGAYALGKRGTEVHCAIDDASVRGRPDPGTADKVPAVAEAWTTMLESATIQLDVMRDGRVRRVDLEGVSKQTVREQVIHQVMREMIVRAVSPLDITLPKQGSTADQRWTQRESLVLGLPSMAGGTVGGAELTVTHAADTPAGIVYAYSGRGTLGWGVEQGDNLRDMMAVQVDGSWMFDPKTGQVRQAQYMGTGTPTAGSSQGTTAGAVYRIAASVALVGDDAPAPTLPPPGAF